VDSRATWHWSTQFILAERFTTEILRLQIQITATVPGIQGFIEWVQA
jgi:hypothetical protein